MTATTERRAYLEKHKVQEALAQATSAVILARADDPVVEIGKKLLDPGYEIPSAPAGSSSSLLSASDYAEAHNITATVAHAVLKICQSQPEDPLAAIGRILSKGDTQEAIAASIAKGLGRRSSVQELADRNILKSPPGAVSGALQSKQAELERKMAASAVEKGLQKRSSVEELADKNILKASPGKVSGALQSKQAELERTMAASAVEKGLQKRSSVEELAEKNILKASPGKVNPALQGAQLELERKMTASAVEKGLQKRASGASHHRIKRTGGLALPLHARPTSLHVPL